MEVYSTDRIRNVAILGHGGAGKTTLVEAIAYTMGITNRMGRIEEGSTISDYDKEEIKRKFSISTSCISVEWEGVKINFLDTPGYFDFIGEVEEALSAVEAAVIVVSCKAGVEAGTIRAWELCEKYRIPRLFFVTDMDDDNANYQNIIEKLTSLYGTKIAPFHLPIKENDSFVGFVNVVKMEGRRFTIHSEYEKCEIPENVKKNLVHCKEALMEAVAETTEERLERYFKGEEFSQEEISLALRENVLAGNIVPVLIGSGINCQGTTMLMQAIVKYFPAPNKTEEILVNDRTKEEVLSSFSEDAKVSASVFKTIVDPFVGKFSLIKVHSGIIKTDTNLWNPVKEMEERIAKLYVLRGKNQIEVKELHAGDIGAISKLNVTTTLDSLTDKAYPIVCQKLNLPKPYTFLRYEAKNKGEEDKVAYALSKMLEEDLTLRVVSDRMNRQTLLYGIGEQQLEIVATKVFTRYKVEIMLSAPKISYQETIRKKVEVQGKYKKQSGGHGQYGDVRIVFEPLEDNSIGYQFEEKIFGGAVPKNYFPAVEKGISESVLKGPLAGYPVVGIKATLIDGSYHPVDSSEMAFKMAAVLAFKKAFDLAMPVLLEPITSLRVVVPEKYTGDIMGDLNKRRGRIMGMNPIKRGRQEIIADIPMAELVGYCTALRSMTGGIGEYSFDTIRYEQAPQDIQDKVVAKSKKTEEDCM